MQLDKRIKSKSDILSCFDIENAKEFVFVDQKGYFANEISSFCDINICKYGTLGSVLGDQQESFYMSETEESFSFFIPDSELLPRKPKEKSYRPYTLNEFLDKYTVCANIRIRQKDRTYQYFGKLIGYGFPTDPNTGKQNGDNDAIVCIGGYSFKLTELFTDYEQYDNMKDIWVPCGVEE